MPVELLLLEGLDRVDRLVEVVDVAVGEVQEEVADGETPDGGLVEALPLQDPTIKKLIYIDPCPAS